MTKRTLPTLTLEALLSGIDQPCEEWDEDRLRAICERYRRHEWNALQVLALTEVPAEDRIWMVCHESLCPSAVARRFAVDVAAQALRPSGVTDERSWAALDAALAYERGEIDEVALKEANAAAWGVARTTACAAAWVAARSAASVAAWDAARSAASVAAWDAASVAASVAARINHCDLLGALLIRWSDGHDVLADSVERAEVVS